jgi:hypothetical protein
MGYMVAGLLILVVCLITLATVLASLKLSGDCSREEDENGYF